MAKVSDSGNRSVIWGDAREPKVALISWRMAFAQLQTCAPSRRNTVGGEVVEDYIECPGHYALFEIRTQFKVDGAGIYGLLSGGRHLVDAVTDDPYGNNKLLVRPTRF